MTAPNGAAPPRQGALLVVTWTDGQKNEARLLFQPGADLPAMRQDLLQTLERWASRSAAATALPAMAGPGDAGAEPPPSSLPPALELAERAFHLCAGLLDAATPYRLAARALPIGKLLATLWTEAEEVRTLAEVLRLHGATRSPELYLRQCDLGLEIIERRTGKKKQ